MNQEPQSPLWTETESKTAAKPTAPSSFGEKLKRERELRSITLDEIANSTKIGTRMLHALEDEEFCKLPGGIFNKGFVRAYARYLGIDEEQAVADYLAAETTYQQAPPSHPTAVGATPGAWSDSPAVSDARPRRSLFAPVVIGLAIVVLVLGGWRYFRPAVVAKNSVAATPTATVPAPAPEKNAATIAAQSSP